MSLRTPMVTRQMLIPSRERSHIRRWEKENHLQKYLGKGYVSSHKNTCWSYRILSFFLASQKRPLNGSILQTDLPRHRLHHENCYDRSWSTAPKIMKSAWVQWENDYAWNYCYDDDGDDDDDDDDEDDDDHHGGDDDETRGMYHIVPRKAPFQTLTSSSEWKGQGAIHPHCVTVNLG